MIDLWLEAIIKELGVNGLLIIGLYFTVGRYIVGLTQSMVKVNDTLEKISNLLNFEKKVS